MRLGVRAKLLGGFGAVLILIGSAGGWGAYQLHQPKLPEWTLA